MKTATSKLDLELWLKGIVPKSGLNQTVLPLCPEIALYLLDETCQQGPYTSEQTRVIVEETPYWCFCWASGQALAKYLLDNPLHVAGKSVLDFGSGSGVAGIAANKAGARRVTACDIDPKALAATTLNAQLNGVEISLAQDIFQLDEHFEIALVADVLYDRENWPLLDAIQKIADNILIADSRINDVPPRNYKIIGSMEAVTIPDLREFDEFKLVTFYQN